MRKFLVLTVLALTFTGVLKATDAPTTAPTITLPTGSGNGTTPGFSWSAVDTATTYELWTDNLTSATSQVIHETALTDTTFTPTTPLTDNNSFRVWIRAGNDGGWGPWSNPKDFATGNAPVTAPTGTPSITDPSGTGNTTTPTVAWTDTGDSFFDLWIDDLTSGASQVVRQTQVVGTSFTPTTPLTDNHSHRAYVRAGNVFGFGPWSAAHDFGTGTAPTAAPTAAPTITAPTGSGNTTTPTVTWTAVAASAYTDVWIDDQTTGTSQVVRNQQAPGTSLTLTTPLIDAHSYRAYVRAGNVFGYGPWSNPQDFGVGTAPVAPPTAAPTFTAPTGSGNGTTPTFVWNNVADASYFDIWVDSVTSGQSQVIRSQQVVGTTFTPTTALADNSSYRAYVRAGNAFGYGPWSNAQVFATGTGAVTAPTGTPSITAPTGTGNTTTPTVTWTTVAGSDYFDLWIDDLTSATSQVVRQQQVVGTTFTPTTALSSGHSFRAYVRAGNNFGYGPWSAPQDFGTGTAPTTAPTGTPTIIAPTGAGNATTPTFTWTAVDGSGFYDIWVDSVTTGESQVIRNTNVAALTFTPTTAIADNGSYRAYVRAGNVFGYGPWSAPQVFATGTGSVAAPATAPTVTAPTGTGNTTMPTFTWTAVPGSSFTDLWIDDLTGNTSQIIRQQQLTGTSFTPTTAIPDNHSFRTYVRAGNGFGYGPWSDGIAFGTGTGPVTAPTGVSTLTQPIGAGISLTPTFSWSAVAGASIFDLWVDDTTANTSQVIRQQNLAGTSYTQSVALTPLHNYRAWIRAGNVFGYAGWSNPVDFTTTTALSITPPANVVAAAIDGNGAVVNYPAATIVDASDPNPTVTYSRPSGTQFPIGTTNVAIVVTDIVGNKATSNFTVQVTALSITPPADKLVVASNAAGVAVTYSQALVSDVVDPRPVVTYSAASGSNFPIGTSTVTIDATDMAGNHASATFHITVTPLFVAPLADVVVTGTQAEGAIVNYPLATVTDPIEATPIITYSQPSGTVFPFGTTSVTVYARDSAGYTASTVFNVTVNYALSITAPADIILEATTPENTAQVDFQVTVIDPIDPLPIISYSNNSGTFFGIGTTLVTIFGTDITGAAVTSSFNVTVTPRTVNPLHLQAISDITTVAQHDNLATVDYPLINVLDDLDPAPILSFDYNIAQPFRVGTTQVTATATDKFGWISVLTYNVTVKPAFEISFPQVKSYLRYEMNGIEPGAPVNKSFVTYLPPAIFAPDLTSPYTVPVTVTYSIPSGTLFPVGTTVVSGTGTDQYGNTSTRQFGVDVLAPLTWFILSVHNPGPTYTTIEDNGDGIPFGLSTYHVRDLTDGFAKSDNLSAPLFAAQVLYTLETGGDVGGGIVANLGTPPFTYTFDPPADAINGNRFPIGEFPWYVTATDVNGLSTEPGVFWITTRPRIAVTKPLDIVAYSNDGVGALVNFPDVQYTSVRDPITNAVEIPNINYSQSSGTYFPIGISTITATVADQDSNSATTSFHVIVVPQSVTLPTTKSNSAVLSISVPELGTDQAPPAISTLPPQGTVVSIGQTSVTMTITTPSEAGILQSQSVPIQVNVISAISITQPDITVQATANNEAPAVFAPIVNDFNDPSPLVEFTQDSGTTFPIGTTSVTASATDSSGNTASVTFNVIVVSPMTITPPPDVTIQATNNNAAIVDFAPATASDAIDPSPVIVYSQPTGTSFPEGTTTVTATATDANGNSASTYFNVTVTSPITITPPDDVFSISTTLNSATLSLASATVTDPLDPAPSVSYYPDRDSTFNVGTSAVTIFVKDARGNTGTAFFNVNITAPFAIVPPDDIVVQATSPGGAMAYYPPATVSDPLDPVPILTYSQASNTMFPIGTNLVTITAQDAFGNIAGASFFVVVSSPLTLTQPDDIAALATSPNGAVVYYPAPDFSDSVDPAPVFSYSMASGATFPLGTTIVVATATDSANNVATTSFNVTVTSPLQIAVQSDVYAEATGPNGAVVNFPAAVVTDPLDPAPILTYTQQPNTQFPMGTTLVTATVTDATGAIAVANFNVNVADSTPPQINAIDDVETPATGPTGALVTYAPATVTDAVSAHPTISYSQASGTLFPIGYTVVAVSVFDDAGNVATIHFRVRVTSNPVVVNPAQATANPVTTATVGLSVLGNDVDGESHLIYTWSAGTAPGTVTFDNNATNVGKSTIAHFTAPGSYNFQVEIKNVRSLSTATSSVSVNVVSTETSLVVVPNPVSVLVGTTQQFSVSGAADQFGTPQAINMDGIAWSVDGGGTVDATGLFTADASTQGNFRVTASRAGISGSAAVRVYGAPTIALAAAANPNPVTGTTTALSVLGSDVDGESVLTYTWSATGGPGDVTFSDNGTNSAKSTTATFYQAGTYNLGVTVTNAHGLTNTSSVSVSVNSAPQRVVVQGNTFLTTGSTAQFVASAIDQFGLQISVAPSDVNWTVTGANSIDQTGVLTADTHAGGPFTVTGSYFGIPGTANFTIVNMPRIVNAAAADPNPVTGTICNLSVLGGDDTGENNLSYTWTMDSGPAGVGFSSNGDNSAKNTTVTFFCSGFYTFKATITNSLYNLSVESFVNVQVQSTPASILSTPSYQPVPVGHSQQFMAQVFDQFNTQLDLQPQDFIWGVSGGGTIDANGLFSAQITVGGPFILSATYGPLTAFDIVSVVSPPRILAPVTAAQNPVTGTTVSLYVTADDDLGDGNISSYQWSAQGSQAAPDFTPNYTSPTTTATFSEAGHYIIQVQVFNLQGLSATSTLELDVNQTPSSIVIAPPHKTLHTGDTQQFSASYADQFNQIITDSAPSVTWNTTGGGVIDSTGLLTADTAAGGPYTVSAGDGNLAGNATLWVTTGPAGSPTLATAAYADSNPVITSVAVLHVRGDDDSGESNLTYTWSVTGTPPGSVFIGNNGSNSARDTFVFFNQPGTYSFLVTIQNADQLSVTSSVDVTVVSTLTYIYLNGNGGTVHNNEQRQFMASAYDQFFTLLVAPVLQWSVNGGGIVDPDTGVLTAGDTPGGPFTITAAQGSISGQSVFRVTESGAPTINDIFQPLPVTTTSTTLSVSADDDGTYTYTWVTVDSVPAAVTFDYYNGTNAAVSINAAFTAAGTYHFLVRVQNQQGLTATSAVDVEVDQSLTAMVVTPDGAVVANDNVQNTQQYSASAQDQFGATMPQPFDLTWSVTGDSFIDNSGLLTAGPTVGTYTVTASSDYYGITATAQVTIVDPTITVTANGSSVRNGHTLQFSATAVDEQGHPVTVPYEWSVSGGGTINQSGLFTAGPDEGAFVVYANSGASQGVGLLEVDNTPPVVNPISDITAIATPANLSFGHITVTLPTFTAFDNFTTNPLITHTPQGNFYQAGAVTTVTVNAADAAGNIGTTTFNVTVIDFEPVQSIESNVADGYDLRLPDLALAKVVDPVPNANPTVTYDSPDGPVLVPGDHSVTATFNDSFGNTAQIQFTVTIKEPKLHIQFTSPAIHPASATVTAGDNVVFSVHVTDVKNHPNKIVVFSGRDMNGFVTTLATTTISGSGDIVFPIHSLPAGLWALFASLTAENESAADGIAVLCQYKEMVLPNNYYIAAINDSMDPSAPYGLQICGNKMSGDSWIPFVYQSGSYIDLPMVGDNNVGGAIAVAKNGTVLGSSYTHTNQGDSNPHTLLWKNGAAIPIDHFTPTGLNDNGVAFGTSFSGGSNSNALYDSNGLTLIDAPSGGIAMNTVGQLVGSPSYTNGNHIGFRWQRDSNGAQHVEYFGLYDVFTTNNAEDVFGETDMPHGFTNFEYIIPFRTLSVTLCDHYGATNFLWEDTDQNVGDFEFNRRWFANDLGVVLSSEGQIYYRDYSHIDPRYGYGYYGWYLEQNNISLAPGYDSGVPVFENNLPGSNFRRVYVFGFTNRGHIAEQVDLYHHEALGDPLLSSKQCVYLSALSNVSVTINSPSQDTSYGSSDTVPVSVDAHSDLGNIVSVQFFSDQCNPPGPGIEMLGEVNSPDPTTGKFNYVWCVPCGGPHWIRVRAIDDQGGVNVAVVRINVKDTTPPVIEVPSTKIVEATSPAGAAVAFDVPATDNDCAKPTMTYSPVSGATFPLGTTSVAVTATDKSGNTAKAKFNVLVQDTTPPVLHLPPNVTVPGTSYDGATVTYTMPTATDLVTTQPKITVSKPSGSVFPYGTTTIFVQAIDNAGNMSEGLLYVTVTGNPPVTPPNGASPPTVTLTSPADGTVTNAKQITFTGTVTTSSSPVSAQVDIFAGGTLVTSGTALEDGSFSIQTHIADGHVAVSARATDMSSGLAGTSTANTIWVDTIAPNGFIVQSDQSSSTIDSPNVFTSPGWFSGTASDQGTGVVSVATGRTATDLAAGFVAASNTAGTVNWTAPYTFPQTSRIIYGVSLGSGLTQGPMNYSATDAAGNSTTSTQGHVNWAPIILQPGNNGKIAIQAGDAILIGCNPYKTDWVKEADATQHVSAATCEDTKKLSATLTKADGADGGVGSRLVNCDVGHDVVRVKYQSPASAQPIEIEMHDGDGNPLKKATTTDAGKDFWASVDVFSLSLTVAADGSHQANPQVDTAPDSNPPTLQTNVTTDDKNLIPLIVKRPINGNSQLTGNVTIKIYAPGAPNGFGNVKLWYDPNTMSAPPVSPAITTLTAAPDSGFVLDISKIDANLGKTLYVQGLTPSPVSNDVTIVAEYDPGSGYVWKKMCRDIVLLSVGPQIPDQPISTIYQFEIAKADWKTTAPEAETDNWSLELDSNQTAVKMLSPFTDDFTPLATRSSAPQGKIQYQFYKTMRILGITNDETTLKFTLVKGNAPDAERIEYALLAYPLRMSQGVDAPSYGEFEAVNQPYGLLGHSGRLVATPEKNDLAGRNIDLSKFFWSTEQLTKEAGKPLKTCINLPKPNGKAIHPTPYSIKIEGYRPGFAKIHGSISNDVDVGIYTVSCDLPVITMPNLGQVQIAALNAEASSADNLQDDAPVNDPGSLAWSTQTFTNNYGVGRPASNNLRNLETHHRRQEFIITQLADPDHALDDPSVFEWPDRGDAGFTRQQASSLLTRAYGTEQLTHGPRVRLIQRLNAFLAADNHDIAKPFLTYSRIAMDSALLDILFQGVSIKYDSNNYPSFVSAGSTFADADVLPGHNMLRAQWSNPSFFQPEFYRSWTMQDLFSNSGAENWKLEHPYTRKILDYMTIQRLQLSVAMSQQIGISSAVQSHIHVSIPDPNPQVSATYTPKVLVHPDLSWETDWTQTGSVSGTIYYKFSGRNLFNRRDCTRTQGRIGSDGAITPDPNGDLVLLNTTEWIKDIYTDNLLASPLSIRERTLAASMVEAWYISKGLQDLDRLKGWQDWEDVTGPLVQTTILGDWASNRVSGRVGVVVLWIGTFFGVENTYQALFGQNFVTNQEITLEEQCLSTVFAAVDIVTMAIPGAKKVFQLSGLAPDFAAKVGAEAAANGVDQMAKDAIELGASATGRELPVGIVDALGKSTEKIVEVGDQAANDLLADGAEQIGDKNVVGQIGPIAESIIPGQAIAEQALHDLPEVVNLSLETPVKQMARWRQAIRVALKQADPVYWTNARLRQFVKNACFVAGTQVSMADGSLKNIEKINVGDSVLSRDQSGRSGQVSSKVVRTHVKISDHVRVLKLRIIKPLARPRAAHRATSQSNSNDSEDCGGTDDDDSSSNEKICTTDEHPFFILGFGWSPARELQPGTLIVAGENQIAICESNHREEHREGIRVYNFEVSKTHTYFVGKNRIWVHNTCERLAEFALYLDEAGANNPYTHSSIKGIVIDGAGNILVSPEAARLYQETVLEKGFLGFTADTFRENLIRYYKLTKSEIKALLLEQGLTKGQASEKLRAILRTIKAYEAHHVFPKQFAAKFRKLGILVHDPRFGSLWHQVEHQAAHNIAEYNERWIEYFKEFPNASYSDCMDQGEKLAKEFGFEWRRP